MKPKRLRGGACGPGPSSLPGALVEDLYRNEQVWDAFLEVEAGRGAALRDEGVRPRMHNTRSVADMAVENQVCRTQIQEPRWNKRTQ